MRDEEQRCHRLLLVPLLVPEPPMVCALSVLELGRSVVRYVNDAGSEIHLSPTDLASPLPTQVELEQFCKQ